MEAADVALVLCKPICLNDVAAINQSSAIWLFGLASHSYEKGGQENVGEGIVSLTEATLARIRCEITLPSVPSYIQVKETAIPLPPPRNTESSSNCPKPQYFLTLFIFITLALN